MLRRRPPLNVAAPITQPAPHHVGVLPYQRPHPWVRYTATKYHQLFRLHHHKTPLMLRAAVQVRSELRAMTRDDSKEAYLQLWVAKGYQIRHPQRTSSQVYAVHPDYVHYYDHGMFDHTSMRWHTGVPGYSKNALAGIVVVGA